MFDFHWPWAALLLPVPLLIRWLWPRRHSAADAWTHGDTSTLLHPALGRLASTFIAARSLTHAGGSLQIILLALHWLEPYTEVHTEGRDLMLAVDTSRSMEALDFKVNGRQVTRMAVTKGVLEKFIQAREGDRIGLVVFGSQAFVLSPMTQDLQTLQALLHSVVARMAGDGTAIGDAIGLGVKKLRERPEGSRVMILITDGENTQGSMPPDMAAQLAAQEGIRIYTIGVGSKGLVPFMENGVMTQVKMEIDEDLLTEIAKATGGDYFRATDSNALESRSVMIPRPLYRWPLGVALLLLLLVGMFPNGIPRSWLTRHARG